MATVASQTKRIGTPQRLMGAKSTSVEGPILYYEAGQFTVADNATAGDLATSLTNLVVAIITPTNAYALTGAAYSDCTGAVTGSVINIVTADPGGTATYNYLLIGTVETT